MWFPKIGEAYYRTSCPPVTNIRSTGSDQYWATCAALGLIVQTQEEAQRIHEEAEEKARKALEPEPWRPTLGQKFFYALGPGHDDVVCTAYVPGNPNDERLIKAGNCFESQEDCRECMGAERKVRKEIQMQQAKRKAEAAK